MNKIIALFTGSVLLFGGSGAMAQEFFDTSVAEKTFSIGGRIGFNTSNRTFPKGNYTNEVLTTWGTGFNVGAVANINFREYLTLQPGFFFESRSGKAIENVQYYMQNEDNDNYYLNTRFNVSNRRCYYFTIPVMGIVKFNLAENVKWNVEFGPYIQICLKDNSGENGMKLYEYIPEEYATFQIEYPAQARNLDVGFKMGTGLTLFDHYYVGVHYLAGVCKAWKVPDGGRNKSWMFTVGYDF